MITPPLSAEDKAKLLALLSAHGLDQAEPFTAANELNKPQPTTVQVPKPFDMADLLQVVSQANADKIVAESFIDSFIGAVGRQDRKAVGTYAAVFASRGLITPEEYAAIKAVLEATEDHTVLGDSWFKAEFPNYSYVIEIQTTHASSDGGLVSDEQGNPIVFTDRQTCTNCTAALIEEARS